MNVNQGLVREREQREANVNVEGVLGLALRNYERVAECFGGEIVEWRDNGSEDCMGKFVIISQRELQSLYHSLSQTYKILQQPSAEPASNQYNFLRQTWHPTPIPSSQNLPLSLPLQDRMDNLNKKISRLKQKTTQLALYETQQARRIWEREVRLSRESGVWDHPVFGIMNQRIAGLGMRCAQMEGRMEEVRRENGVLGRRCGEIQARLVGYKEKNRKIEKQMFELAKKKAQLQKQLLQKPTPSPPPPPPPPLQLQNKQNQNTSQYLLLLEQQHKTSRPSLQPGTASLRDKYQKARQISRRSVVGQISPNTSMDSVRSVRFQRTSGKKLIVRGT